ncbi:uncharacterized protein [Montipora capricornis]|uniref:uncharacterized protein n=1 Tax=Montipora capricornis TaxID=246305 RepID=UPI0035F12016
MFETTFTDILPFNHLDDSSFSLALYELQNGPVHFNSERFSSLYYNPILTNLNASLTQTDSLDPDIHFNARETPCDYFIENQFNEMLKREQYSDADFSLLHLNIRSLQRNINNLTNLLSSLEINFSIVGISETWLSDSFHSVDIDGFRFVHKYRQSRPGGGVGLYVSNDIEFKERKDFCFNDVDIAESLFIEVLRPRVKNIIVGIVYRPPNQGVDEFLTKINESLGKISRENKICFLLGDFNINLMNYQHHHSTGQFLDEMYSNMLLPLITRPTRITPHTATLIDNIFVNNFFVRSRSGLLFTDISDHLPVFSIHSDNTLGHHSRQDPIFVRDKNPINRSKFVEKLEGVEWSSLAGYNDPHTAYTSFLNKITKIYNDCFPVRKLIPKKRSIKKPWLTKALLKSIKRKNKLYKQFLHKPTQNNNLLYKSFKNKLNHILRSARRLYYEKKLEYAKANTHATWKILNDILNRKKSKPKVNSIFTSDGQEISDPVIIANKFCKYFSSIGPNLAKEIQSHPFSHKDFLSGSFAESIFFNPATKEEIIVIAQSFASNKAAGYDNIPMSLIKESIQLISEPLKRVVRIIDKSHFNAHSDPIFKKLGILKFHDLNLLQLGQFMFSYQIRTLPPKLASKFTLNSQIHTYYSRNSHAFRLPFCRTNIKQFSVFYQGPKFYNSLDIDIMNSSSTASFKKALKSFFFNNYSEN